MSTIYEMFQTKKRGSTEIHYGTSRNAYEDGVNLTFWSTSIRKVFEVIKNKNPESIDFLDNVVR